MMLFDTICPVQLLVSQLIFYEKKKVLKYSGAAERIFLVWVVIDRGFFFFWEGGDVSL